MVVFAQLSTSVSDGQIRLIILALLGVAVLLALLTVWYAVKTSPRRRVEAAQARRQRGAPGRPAERTEGPRHSEQRPPAAAGQSAAAPGPSPAMHEPPSLVDEMDDEWTRLTAPQRRPTNG